MHIVLCCATRRGCRFLEKLAQLQPQAELTVFSFPEEPWEPPFLEDIRGVALTRGHPFIEARQIGSARHEAFWQSTPVDLLLAVNWRYLIPAEVYRRPRLGSFVFHDSLLPAYRGFSPTVWAILNGEDHTGVSLFEMSEEVDSGGMVGQERVAIGPDDTIADVTERVTQAYLALLERHLDDLLRGNAVSRPQDEAQATYTCKRMPEDNEIDWTASSSEIYNLIRAVSAPYPGAFTYLSGRKMTVWTARRLGPGRAYVGRVPGRVAEVRPGVGAVVLAGDGGILLTRVQLEGDKTVTADEVLRSPSLTLGR
ncbi:MAG: methionyl-tRNA formyltransferase-like protein [Planctomycetes bacterium]|nr:methionyl-tRNA formyltransferase-like protein [Planctomycetota bacterium]